jgi:hypothetical protein
MGALVNRPTLTMAMMWRCRWRRSFFKAAPVGGRLLGVDVNLPELVGDVVGERVVDEPMWQALKSVFNLRTSR